MYMVRSICNIEFIAFCLGTREVDSAFRAHVSQCSSLVSPIRNPRFKPSLFKRRQYTLSSTHFIRNRFSFLKRFFFRAGSIHYRALTWFSYLTFSLGPPCKYRRARPSLTRLGISTHPFRTSGWEAFRTSRGACLSREIRVFIADWVFFNSSRFPL